MRERIEHWLDTDNPEARERRNVFRAHCSCGVHLEFAGQELAGTAVDISPRGTCIRLKARKSPHLGQAQPVVVRFAAELPEDMDERVDAQVRWMRRQGPHDILVGLAFTEPERELTRTWVHSVLVGVFHQRANQKRQHLRVRSELVGRLTRRVRNLEHEPVSSESVDVKVLDLSIGGALLEAGEVLPQGTMVRLQFGPLAPLDHLTVPGLVQRVSKPSGVYHIGILFCAETPEQRRALLEYVRHLYANLRLRTHAIPRRVSPPGLAQGNW